MTKGKLYDDIMYGGQHKEEPKGELRIGYTAKLKNIEIVTKCRAKKKRLWNAIEQRNVRSKIKHINKKQENMFRNEIKYVEHL